MLDYEFTNAQSSRCRLYFTELLLTCKLSIRSKINPIPSRRSASFAVQDTRQFYIIGYLEAYVPQHLRGKRSAVHSWGIPSVATAERFPGLSTVGRSSIEAEWISGHF